MAIISIPTSIGGISIPGELVNGPLGVLFGNKYSLPNYKYPRDLESATRGHVIQFTIKEVTPLSFDDVTSYVSGAVDKLSDQFNNIGSSISSNGLSATVENVWNGAVETVSNFGDNVSSGTFSTSNLTFAQKKANPVAVISLYIPDTVNFQYASNYTDVGLTDIIAKTVGHVPLVGGVLENAVSGASSELSSGAGALALRAAGYAVNPQQQLLFQGLGFRTYQMAFTFTPYSQEEADTVAKIIKLFKQHSAPKIMNQSAGMFFSVPSQFDVKFLFNGNENTNINKIASSVIESIDVNYAPNGWSAHVDGAPVQTTLTMNFKEMVLIDRSKIEEGY